MRCKRNFLINYLEKGRTINSEYQIRLLDQLNEKIRKFRPCLQKKEIIFYQDSAPSHTSILTMGKTHELKYQLLEYPPYFQDLDPSDLHLFRLVEKFIFRKRFLSKQDGYFYITMESIC